MGNTSDDDPTPAPRRGTHWGDDRRALEGRRHTAVHGVPIVPVDDDRTPVWDEDDDTPLTRTQANRLVRWMRPPRDLAAKLEQDVAALTADLAALQVELQPVRRISRWAASVAFAALLAVGAFLYARGDREGGDRVRLEQLEKTVDRLERLLERHSSTTPATPPLLTSTQGTP